MPTQVDISVGTTGRDYSTLQNAVDNIATEATSADLVTNDENVVITVYDNETNSSEILIDESLTTDATRNVVIEGDIYTDGTENGTGRNIRNTSTGITIRIRDDDIVLRKLRLSNSDFRLLYYDDNAAQGCIVKQCVITGYDGTTAETGITAITFQSGFDHGDTRANRISDCAFYGVTTSVAHGTNTANADTHVVEYVNNSFLVGTGGNAAADRLIQNQNGSGGSTTTHTYNNVSYCTGAALFGNFYDTGAATFTHNAGGNCTTLETNDFPGKALTTTPSTSSSPGAGTWALYTSDTDGTPLDDADNDILDEGEGPSTNSRVDTEDILGNARAGTTCDPGCFQVTAVAASTIEPTGIASGEALGSPEADGAIEPTGFAETTAYGSPTLDGFVLPTGIEPPDGGQTGAPILSAEIELTGIASSSAVGQPEQDGESRPTGVASTVAFGTPNLFATAIDPTGIASTAAIGTHSVVGILEPPSIASGEALGSPMLGVGVSPTGLSSTAALGAPTLDAELLPTAIASGEAVGSPTVATGGPITVPVDGLANVSEVGVPWVQWLPADMPVAYKPAPPERPNTGVLTSVSGTDITAASDTIYNLVGNVGQITINGVQRVEIRGNGFQCDTIIFGGTTGATDVYIHDIYPQARTSLDSGVQCTSGMARVWFHQVICDNLCYRYGFYGSGTFNDPMTDVLSTECEWKSTGDEAGYRAAGGTRMAVIGGEHGTPTKHAWRMHGLDAFPATYYWLSDCTLQNQLYIGYQSGISNGDTERWENCIIRRTNVNIPYPAEGPNTSWFNRSEIEATPGVGHGYALTFEDNLFTVDPAVTTNTSLATFLRDDIEADAAVTADSFASNNFLSTELATDTVFPVGVASGEAIGALQVDGEVLPTGVASTEAVGAPTIINAPNILPDSIAGASAVGAVTTSATVFPTGFAETSALGEVLLIAEGVITVVGIGGGEAIGVPSLISTIWDIPVPETPAPGSWGELLKQTWLAATYTATQRWQLNGDALIVGGGTTPGTGDPVEVNFEQGASFPDPANDTYYAVFGVDGAWEAVRYQPSVGDTSTGAQGGTRPSTLATLRGLTYS